MLLDAVAPVPPSLNFAVAVNCAPGVDKPSMIISREDDEMEQSVALASPTVTLQKPPWAGVIKFAPVMVAMEDCMAAG